MVSVRLHIQGGTVWALCKCSACRTVHNYTVRAAMAAPITCKQCGHEMDIKGAVIEAVERTDDATPPDGGSGGDGSERSSTPERETPKGRKGNDDGGNARGWHAQP